ncbi:MAG: tetratricopeptide repeat protein [Desulfosudaceae bacterium]
MLNLSRFLFIAALIIAPLFSGKLSSGLPSGLLFGLVLLTGAALTTFLTERLTGEKPVYKVPGVTWLLLAVAGLIFRLIPLPQPVLALLSPETAAIWTKIANLAGQDVCRRLSLNLPRDLDFLVLLVACLGLYWLAVHLLSNRSTARRTGLFLVFYGSLLSLALALDCRPCQDRLDHPALAVMTLPLGLGLALTYRPAKQFGSPGMKLSGLLEDRDTPLFAGLSLAVLATAWSLAARPAPGGLIAPGLAILFLAGFLFRDRHRVHAVSNLTTVILVGAGCLAVTAGLIKDNSLLLAGLAEPEITGSGLAAFLLTAGFLTTIFLRARRCLKTRKNALAILLCQGALSGMGAMLCLGLLNSKQVSPASLLYFTILCSLIIAAGHTRLKPGPSRVRAMEATYLERPSRRLPLFILLVVLGVWPVLLILTAGQWIGAGPGGLPEQAGNIQTEKAGIKTLATISALIPEKPAILISRGDAELAAGRPGTALALFQRALRLAPTRAGTLRRIGRAAFLAGHDTTLAEAAFQTSLDFFPSRPANYRCYADFLLATNQKDKALAMITRGVSLDPEQTGPFFLLLEKRGISPTTMAANWPDNARALTRLAGRIDPEQDGSLRRRLLRRAVAAAASEDPAPAEPFRMLADLYREQGRDSQSIAVLKQGLIARPSDTELMFELARAYERSLITYKAKRLYQKILVLDSGHTRARQRLAEING